MCNDRLQIIVNLESKQITFQNMLNKIKRQYINLANYKFNLVLVLCELNDYDITLCKDLQQTVKL